MPYKIKKRSCTQSDGDKGSYVLSYTSDKGKKYNNCHTSKKKAQGQIAAIEAESVNMDLKEAKEVKLGNYAIKWSGSQLMFYVNGKLQKAVDVNPNSFTDNDFKATVKKLAQIKKLENELPFSFLAEGDDINEKLDNIDDKEADTDYEDLEDKDIDNDGDEDSSDKYLHHKLSVVNKKAKNESINENQFVIIDPKGNVAGVGMKMQAAAKAKKLGGEKKGFFIVPAKAAKKARRALEKAKGNYSDAKYKDTMFDLYFEIAEAKGAPKMKSSPFVQKVRDAGLALAKAANGMKFEDPNGFAKSKKSYEKAVKAIQQFQLDVTRFGKNY